MLHLQTYTYSQISGINSTSWNRNSKKRGFNMYCTYNVCYVYVMHGTSESVFLINKIKGIKIVSEKLSTHSIHCNSVTINVLFGMLLLDVIYRCTYALYSTTIVIVRMLETRDCQWLGIISLL